MSRYGGIFRSYDYCSIALYLPNYLGFGSDLDAILDRGRFTSFEATV
jgi:hypothetical protein